MVCNHAVRGCYLTLMCKRGECLNVNSYPSFCINDFGLCGADSVTFTFL